MGPIHVALNACFLDPGVSGGPESYLLGLAPALAAARPDARFTVLTTRRGARGLVDRGWTSFATVVALPSDEGERARRLATELQLIPAWVRRNRPTLLHNLANLGPPRPVAAKQVLTLHDLTFLRIQTFSRATTTAFSQLALRNAKQASRIITATAASRQELHELAGIDPTRVDVVPHGRRAILPADPAVVERVREAHQLTGRRVAICVAAKRPHKNQQILIEALPQLPDDVVLVLAGHPEAYDQQLRARAAELGVTDRVRFVDYVPDDELEALWRVADAAAFPTRGEGFGLPVIEAMDRGLPVACSRIDVLREVSGGLAHLFDPDNAAECAAALAAALEDPRPRSAWESHAAAFTWERAADLTWQSYDRALAAGRRVGSR